MLSWSKEWLQRVFLTAANKALLIQALTLFHFFQMLQNKSVLLWQNQEMFGFHQQFLNTTPETVKESRDGALAPLRGQLWKHW